MAAGDVYIKTDSDLDTTETFDMEPSTGAEVVIHNITVNPAATTDTCTLRFVDETGTPFTLDVDTITGSGSWMGMFLHCKENQYYRVVCSANNCKVAADGVYTK